ncbi:MAG TPA: choice-of-anchor L domain-containing protein [Flavobacteriales bacterium]
MQLSSHGPVTLLLTCSLLSAQAQIVLQQDLTADSLVQRLLGPAVAVSEVRFNYNEGSEVPPVGVGISEMGRFDGSATSIGIADGIFLCNGVAEVHIPGPNDRLSEETGGIAGWIQTPDIDLSQLTAWPYWQVSNGENIYSKAVLEFDFVPENDMISFRYVFSSEEYERWACSQYNDVFGFFLSGPGIPTDINGPFTNNAMNIAFVPGSLSPVSINRINSGATIANMNCNLCVDPWQYCSSSPNWLSNVQYYRYNGGQWMQPQALNTPQTEAPYNTDSYYIQHNGMTVVLTASASVLIGETYHIKLALGNVSDGKYPSAVFLEGNSFKSSDRFTMTVEGANVDLSGTDPVLHQSDEDSVYLRFHRWGGFYLEEELQISVEGDAVAGEDYAPALPASIHFDQLDSSVTFALAVPVQSDSTGELIVNLITSNGNKVSAFPLLIEEQISTGMSSADVVETLTVFPNPAEDVLNIVLPYGLKGRTELEVLDPAGRVVKRQVLNGTAKAVIDLGGLPNGLYMVKAMANGRMATARVSVRR